MITVRRRSHCLETMEKATEETIGSLFVKVKIGFGGERSSSNIKIPPNTSVLDLTQTTTIEIAVDAHLSDILKQQQSGRWKRLILLLRLSKVFICTTKLHLPCIFLEGIRFVIPCCKFVWNIIVSVVSCLQCMSFQFISYLSGV
mmetsp:Transcript_17892/g.27818  ORF Transcript_17892/g.27818 Transcript_17892/m.27818 type:complete len:144 (+) Transcript_17892:481-912(+)